jgi:hypothetical protein
MSRPRSLSMTLLAVFLIVYGVQAMVGIYSPAMPFVVGAIALAAGIAILMGR